MMEVGVVASPMGHSAALCFCGGVPCSSFKGQNKPPVTGVHLNHLNQRIYKSLCNLQALHSAYTLLLKYVL